MAKDSDYELPDSRFDAGSSEASRPWLSIPLEDYEGHMNAPEVRQLPVLAELFRRVLERWRPESVAIAGVAGGNGLEGIDSSVTRRTGGIDINEEYLETAAQRFGALPGLELNRCDLTMNAPKSSPFALVHAALLFEHTGLGTALDNVLSMIEPRGKLSVVLQLPSSRSKDVAVTKYTSLQTVKQNFALIDLAEFRLEMASRDFELIEEDNRVLPGGKTFWLGVFARNA
jgi:hypothetical protein